MPMIFWQCVAIGVSSYPSVPARVRRVTCSTHLAEEAGDESFPDVDVVVSAGELSAGAAEGEAVHDPGQLLPHTVGQLEGAVADKIIVAPLGILPV